VGRWRELRHSRREIKTLTALAPYLRNRDFVLKYVLNGSSRATGLSNAPVFILQISHDRMGESASSADPTFAWESFA
jgi:hypothetical protein